MHKQPICFNIFFNPWEQLYGGRLGTSMWDWGCALIYRPKVIYMRLAQHLQHGRQRRPVLRRCCSPHPRQTGQGKLPRHSQGEPQKQSRANTATSPCACEDGDVLCRCLMRQRRHGWNSRPWCPSGLNRWPIWTWMHSLFYDVVFLKKKLYDVC